MNMKNNLIIFCSLIVTIFSALSCTDDNKTVNTTEFTLNTTLPEGFEEPSISNMVVKFTNVNTGRVTNNTTFENNQIHVTLRGRNVSYQHGRFYSIQTRGRKP